MKKNAPLNEQHVRVALRMVEDQKKEMPSLRIELRSPRPQRGVLATILGGRWSGGREILVPHRRRKKFLHVAGMEIGI